MEKILILRFTDGLIDGEKYAALKKLAMVHDAYRIMILAVSPDDSDTLDKMVSSACLELKAKSFDEAVSDVALKTLIKKLAVAVRYIVSGYKLVMEFGDERQERDCTFSIKTPYSPIHIPNNTTDKKAQRFVDEAIALSNEAKQKGLCDMLIYYDADSDKTICRSKDDYIRTLYNNTLTGGEGNESNEGGEGR